MYMNMESIIITITTMIMNVAVDMITKNMNIITMTTTMNVAVDMITKNMNIITMTTTMNAAVDMIMRNMSIITTITTMNAAADMIIMIITIITQMRYLQAGDVRRLRNTQEKVLRRCLEALSASEDYGIILRAKGMLPAEDGTWIYFDMVPEETEIREGAPEYTGRLCVIGSKLKEDKLAELFGLA